MPSPLPGSAFHTHLPVCFEFCHRPIPKRPIRLVPTRCKASQQEGHRWGADRTCGVSKTNCATRSHGHSDRDPPECPLPTPERHLTTSCPPARSIGRGRVCRSIARELLHRFLRHRRRTLCVRIGRSDPASELRLAPVWFLAYTQCAHAGPATAPNASTPSHCHHYERQRQRRTGRSARVSRTAARRTQKLFS